MVQPRKYTVTLMPVSVEKSPSGIEIIGFTFFDNRSQLHEIQAASLPDMLATVRQLARDMGLTCTAHIDVPRGERKPPGFDKAVRSLGNYMKPEG